MLEEEKIRKSKFMSDNPNWAFDAQSDINSPEFTEKEDGNLGAIKNEPKAIANSRQALQIAQKLSYNDIERDIRRARVLSAFNGTAPYCESDLVAQAQGYRYNVSFGLMEGSISRAVVPYNELTINISDLTEIKANLDDKKLKTIQVEFGKIMDKWGKWPKFVTRLNQDLVLNGYNNAIFPSDYDPFPTFVSQKHGFVDEGAPNEVQDLEVYVWRKSYMIHELYSKISDESIAEKAGWNVENVKDALTKATPESIWNKNLTTSGQWTAVQQAIREGSLFVSVVGAKMIDTYHVFAAEVDGKVTHYIVLDNNISMNDSSFMDREDGPELFKKEKRFNSFQDFLVYFDMETGDGTWHGSKGVGQRVFNTHKANDKMMNSALDTSFTAGLTLIQPGDQVQQEELTLSVVGPFAVIPNGVQINPQALPNLAGTFFQMQALLSNTLETRVGDVVPQGQSTLTQGQETATAAKLKAGRQELITRGNLKRYIDPISQVMSIIVRRLLKENSPNAYAKEFQRELKRKGISEDDIKEIRGARNTGKIEDILGNTAQATQVIFGEFRNDPDIDQEKLKFKRIASVLDADAADDLLIKDTDQTKEIEAARQQELELTTILTGKPVPVSPRDFHEVHIQFLLQDIGTKIQAQATNFNPNEIPILKLEVQHAAEHLKFLEGDKAKKQITSKFSEALKQANDGINTLEKQKIQLAKAQIDQAAKIAKTPEEQAQVQQMQNQIKQQETSL